MSAGINVASPSHEAQRNLQSNQVVQDAHALDCRIRAAVETFDSLHNWIKGLGNEVSETARRHCQGIQEAM
eukprot:5346678-Pyramimonas_sp.AAC.1